MRIKGKVYEERPTVEDITKKRKTYNGEKTSN